MPLLLFPSSRDSAEEEEEETPDARPTRGIIQHNRERSEKGRYLTSCDGGRKTISNSSRPRFTLIQTRSTSPPSREPLPPRSTLKPLPPHARSRRWPSAGVRAGWWPAEEEAEWGEGGAGGAVELAWKGSEEGRPQLRRWLKPISGVAGGGGGAVGGGGGGGPRKKKKGRRKKRRRRGRNQEGVEGGREEEDAEEEEGVWAGEVEPRKNYYKRIPCLTDRWDPDLLSNFYRSILCQDSCHQVGRLGRPRNLAAALTGTPTPSSASARARATASTPARHQEAVQADATSRSLSRTPSHGAFKLVPWRGRPAPAVRHPSSPATSNATRQIKPPLPEYTQWLHILKKCPEFNDTRLSKRLGFEHMTSTILRNGKKIQKFREVVLKKFRENRTEQVGGVCTVGNGARSKERWAAVEQAALGRGGYESFSKQQTQKQKEMRSPAWSPVERPAARSLRTLPPQAAASGPHSSESLVTGVEAPGLEYGGSARAAAAEEEEVAASQVVRMTKTTRD
uniref:Uncharacterized protein n=1 Tax=Oryza punctata TaxID=4537 RepID=A0A0E0M5P2_ORYPU